jgi:hypothetical protein
MDDERPIELEQISIGYVVERIVKLPPRCRTCERPTNGVLRFQWVGIKVDWPMCQGCFERIESQAVQKVLKGDHDDASRLQSRDRNGEEGREDASRRFL